MRCPKCGAFMEQGKDICLMCGINVKTYVPENINNMSFNDNNAMFGSGLGNSSSNNDFSNYNPNLNSSYNQKKEEYNNRNNYRDVTLHPVKNGEKDIFDFFAENKKIITLFFCLFVIAVLSFAGYKYYQHKTKEVPLEPLLMNLYYEVDETFKAVSGNSGNVRTYSKSGEKGNDCSITITYGTSTSGDHVLEYFNEVKASLEPEKDANGSVINVLDIYIPQDSKMELNESTWYYLNIFYKKDEKSEATQLRYKYLTSMYNGYFYDIELVNNSNDALCNASLDNFSKSLKFVES